MRLSSAGEESRPTRWRVTAAVLVGTSLLTAASIAYPAILATLGRSRAAISGEAWRFVTPLFVERGGWAEVAFNLGSLAAAVLGLWRMQKWGVVALAAVAIGVHILYLFTGLLNVETFLIYAGTLGMALYFYRRMR